MKKLLILSLIFFLVSCKYLNKKDEYQRDLLGRDIQENIKKVANIVKNVDTYKLLDKLAKSSKKSSLEVDKIVMEEFLNLVEKGKLKAIDYNSFLKVILDFYEENKMTDLSDIVKYVAKQIND